MAQEQRQASDEAPKGVSERDQQIADDKQTSEGAGSTESQDGGNASFDVTAMYANPLNPEEQITGAELVAIANQGKLYRKAQSEYDQKSVEYDKLTADNEELQMAKDKAEAALATMQDTERVLKTLKDVGITGKSKDSGEYGEFDETPVADPEEIYRRVEALAQEQISKATEKLTADNAKRENDYFTDLNIQQETERYITQQMSSARQVTLDTYKAAMPDVDLSKIEASLDMVTLAAVKDADAVTALRSGDPGSKETWAALHAEAENYRNKSMRTLAELHVQQSQSTVEKQRQEEIESASGGLVPDELADMKPARTKADAKKNRELRLAAAKKRVAVRDRAMNR